MRQRLRKTGAFASIVVGVIGLTAGPSGAEHSHSIVTPGACVDRNGSGFGTLEVHTDHEANPGDNTFHERFHKGTPGTFAFEQHKNPVSVAGKLCP